MTTNDNGPTLQQLVLNNKGDLSYAGIADRSGGDLNAKGLQKLITSQFTAFPSPATLNGISRALGLPLQDVVLAAGRSLGLRLHDSNPDDLVLIGAKRLPSASQETLRSMAREMLNWMDGKYDRPSDATPAPDNVTEMPRRDWGNMAADRGEPGIDPEQLPDS